jgi:hypothetical protein
LALFLYFMFCCRNWKDLTDAEQGMQMYFTIIAFRLGKEKQFI